MLPSLAPASPDARDVYLVLDNFGERLGHSWRETDEEQTDRETVIADLIDGQYKDPVRVVVFNTARGTSRDVSQELADLIFTESSQDGFDVPPFLQLFVERHQKGFQRQLPLPLRDSQFRG